MPPDGECVEVRLARGKRMRTVRDEESLKKLVAEKGVIVLFCTSWCGPCHSLKTLIKTESIEEELRVKIFNFWVLLENFFTKVGYGT